MAPDLPAVLVLAPHHPPEAGAGAARLAGLERHLAELGHEVEVVAPEGTYLRPQGRGEPDPPGVRVHRVRVIRRGRGAAASAWHQWRLSHALRRRASEILVGFQADVVLVSSPPPVSALAGLGLRGADGRPLPVVVDVRDIWPDVLVEAGIVGARSPAARLLRAVERRLHRGATALTTVTRGKRARLAERAAPCPVALVPNAVDECWFDGPPAPAGVEEAPAAFEVLHAGNVGSAQDVALLVRALARLAAEDGGRRVHGTIVGDGQELPRVRQLAASLGAPVSFAGVESRARVSERLARCGCACVTLVSAELADSVPSKLLEAMARGVPVALVAAGEAAAIVRASGGGLVSPPGDVGGLASTLRALADAGPAARLAMGTRGRDHAARCFRRESAARAMSRVLADAAAQARPTVR